VTTGPAEPAGPLVITETPRLRLRRLTPADVGPLLAVYGDPQVTRWVGDSRPLPRADCERWVEVTHRNYANRGYGMFAIDLRAGERAVGFCGLVHPADQPEPEIKYALRQDQWGRGLATEAARALLTWGAAQCGLRHVIATAAPQNEASHHVLLKIGLRRGALRSNPDGSHTQLFAWTAPAGP
jgi:RimJ/RimL family protein N-acetyltransferase